MSAHLLALKQSKFVLWRPATTTITPKLIIGEYKAGNPPTLENRQVHNLLQQPGTSDLWAIDASACTLTDGKVYHYWFEVTDSSPFRNGSQILCTDPTSYSVDWRLKAPQLPSPYEGDDRDPAAVILFKDGMLVPCDASGETSMPLPPLAAGTPNNRMVIYELPTSFTRTGPQGDPQVGIGTFRDVTALVKKSAEGANFADLAVMRTGRSHLQELGINALELLPIADSFVDREWGYAPSNYFAPDFDLGMPEENTSPTANTDLTALVTACHDHGIRFIVDTVMAFGTHATMENVNFAEFHIDAANAPARDPDRFQSSRNGEDRDRFGGRLWRYALPVTAYDPVAGGTRSIFPARQLMKVQILRWMKDFAIDGIRIDSVNNIANWDFVGEFRDFARSSWGARGGSMDKFLVIGEELSVPHGLISEHRLDALWNEDFKRMVRYAILGQNDEHEPSFEWTVRKMIDCRLIGFSDGSESVNYVGSHDVGGFRNERLFNFLLNNRVWQTEERIKLAFTCLLTAVGIPMIFAGDEFADQHDLSTDNPAKQRDAVNFERVDEPFRKRVFEYVSRLTRIRTSSNALAVNDTEFIHVDFNDGKRVLAWKRGTGSDILIVVANFSDFDSGRAGSNEYRVQNWPAAPSGKRWRDVSQDRDVDPAWAGREAIYPWEGKVYALV